MIFPTIIGLGLTLLAVVVTWLVLPPVISLSARAGWEAENYHGIRIPSSGGLLLLPGLSIAWLVYLILGALRPAVLSLRLLNPVIMVMWGFALLGLIDDRGGAGEHGGFGHHLKALFRREVTTGGVKALGGGILALLTSLQVSKSLGWAFIDAGVIALCANFINLLDLRPGRAVKGFVILMVPAVLAALFRPELAVIVLPVLGVVVFVGAKDLRGELMLGDTGANLLGAFAGLVVAAIQSPPLTIGALVIVAGLNLKTEKVSISQKIADSPFLSWLDRLGRSD